MLDRVVSGGKRGADQAGWKAARKANIPTSGWLTRGFLTETADGSGDESHLEFAELYGARELSSGRHAARTEADARDSDAALWFGSTDRAARSRLSVPDCGRRSRA
jgi:hypothetical protein